MKRISNQRTIWYLLLLTLAALALMSACGEKGETDAKVQKTVAAEPVSDSVASADGVMIHYTVAGHGEPALVFVHGWCCDGTYWKDQVAAFDSTHKVITVDLAGHGQSGINRSNWTIEAFGGDVAAVVEKLDLKKVILIGHSMGGPVDIEAARKLGDRVVGLIGVDTYQNVTAKFPPEQQKAFLQGMSADFVAFTKGFVGQMFPSDADTTLRNRVAQDMASAPPEVGIAAMKALFDYDAVAALKEMPKPIYAINADMWPTKVDDNRSVMDFFEVDYMKGHGHFLYLEDPATFNGLLAADIAKLTGAPTHE